MRFVIVTGMSGAGKSTAMKMMEDIGFFCIDNLPIPLVEKLVEFYEKFESNIDKVALGVDIRDKEGLNHMDKTLSNLDDKKVRYDILFLDEPFKGLDNDTKNVVINYTKSKIKGKTVVLVTHDLSECEQLADEIIRL